MLLIFSNTDQCTSKYPTCFTGVTLIYTFILLTLLMELHHSKPPTKNGVLTDQQYTVSHQEIHDGLVRSKSQIHYSLHYLPLNTNHHHLLALDMMPS